MVAAVINGDLNGGLSPILWVSHLPTPRILSHQVFALNSLVTHCVYMQ
uniref:Uncharacterized protein n=1 Tax=Moniliophthora roreri TaxID=221103 RepID=A0A0W0FIJ3_MONRR